MSIINHEQEIHNKCKKELEVLSDDELNKIAKNETQTHIWLMNSKNKHYQIAAFELLRERKNKNTK